MDEDGDSTEVVPYDFGHGPRIREGTSGRAVVDQGAFEADQLANNLENPDGSRRASVFEIEAFPNPFGNTVSIVLTGLRGSGDILTIDVFDVLGRHVRRVFERYTQPGQRIEVMLRATDFAAGCYVVAARNVDSSKSIMICTIK